MDEHKVYYFQGFVQTGKAQGLKVARSAKCKSYNERIALESFSK